MGKGRRGRFAEMNGGTGYVGTMGRLIGCSGKRLHWHERRFDAWHTLDIQARL